jgi:periplasmic nitrate reductase NapD
MTAATTMPPHQYTNRMWEKQMAMERDDGVDPSKRKILFGDTGPGTNDASAPYQIASILIQANPKNMPAIRQRFAPVSSIEFHDAPGIGKLIATIETRDDHELVEFVDLFEQTPGVMSVALVYHQIDDGGDDA